jgi:hypothetical protein
VTVFAGVWMGQASLRVTLGSEAAPYVVQNVSSPNQAMNVAFTLRARPIAAATLVITWEQVSDDGNITWQSASIGAFDAAQWFEAQAYGE